VKSSGSQKNGKFYAAVPCIAVRIFIAHREGVSDAEIQGFCGVCGVNQFDTEKFLLLLRGKNLITKELGWRLKNLHLT
jgi:hypothetical protein